VFPSLPIDGAANDTSAHAVFIGQLRPGKASGSVLSGASHVVVSQDRKRVACPADHCPVSSGILGVLMWRCPVKVFGGIVRLVSVPVRRMTMTLRRWPIERLANQSVNIGNDPIAGSVHQGNNKITSAAKAGRQVQRQCLSRLSGSGPSDSAVTRNFVVRE